jgi:uncharacterized protein
MVDLGGSREAPALGEPTEASQPSGALSETARTSALLTRVEIPALIVGAVVLALGVGGLGVLGAIGRSAGHSDTTRTWLVSVLAILSLSGAATASLGLLLYVLLPPFRDVGRVARFGSHRIVLASVGTLVLVGNLLPLAVLRNRPEFGQTSLDGFAFTAIVLQLSMLGLVYARAVRPGLVTVHGLGFRIEGLGRMIRMGLLGGLALFGLNVVTGLLLTALGVEATQLEMFAWVRALPYVQFLVVLLLGSVLAPLAEEVFFRGFVYQTYKRRYSPLVAALLSSVLFASLHVNLQAFMPILLMGLLLAWLYQRTGSLLPGTLAHGLNNGVVFTAFYLFAA